MSGLGPRAEFAFILHFTAHFTRLDLSSPPISLGPLFHCYKISNQTNYFIKCLLHKNKIHLEHIHFSYLKTEQFQWHGGNIWILALGGNF